MLRKSLEPGKYGWYSLDMAPTQKCHIPPESPAISALTLLSFIPPKNAGNVNKRAEKLENIVLFCLHAYFTSDHLTFVQSIQGLTCHGCINHDIVVRLCSKLFLRFSYCIHLGFGKKLWAHMGIEPLSFQLWAVYSTLPLDQSANLCVDFLYSGIY